MNTRLLLVILRGGSCDKLLSRLLEAHFVVTTFSSAGGFFRRQSTTLMIGVPQDQVEAALNLIRTTCPTPRGADEHQATVFVLNAGRFVQI
jgi:uncharacterized protein YaaQ